MHAVLAAFNAIFGYVHVCKKKCVCVCVCTLGSGCEVCVNLFQQIIWIVCVCVHLHIIYILYIFSGSGVWSGGGWTLISRGQDRGVLALAPLPAPPPQQPSSDLLLPSVRLQHTNLGRFTPRWHHRWLAGSQTKVKQLKVIFHFKGTFYSLFFYTGMDCCRVQGFFFLTHL